MKPARKQLVRQLEKEINLKGIETTNQLVVGNVYFLSDFYDKAGCTVRVLAKSTKRNIAGWNSSVDVKVLENLGANKQFYAVGTVHTVNACHLYVNRADAAQKIATH